MAASRTKPIKIGMIGLGNRSVLANYWHAPNGRSIIAGAADLNRQRLERFKDKINSEAFVTDDYRDLLAREGIDAIAVTSPDYCHEDTAAFITIPRISRSLPG